MCNQLPRPTLAGTGQADSISNAASNGDGGHRWDSLGISGRVAVCHGVAASLAGKLHAQSEFVKASYSKGIL